MSWVIGTIAGTIVLVVFGLVYYEIIKRRMR